MMHPDVPGDPLQRCWQHIMRRPLKCGIVNLPRLALGPMGFLELVLHIEQPHPDGRANHQRRDIDQHQGHHPAQPQNQRHRHGDKGVGPHRRYPIAPARRHQPDRQTVLQDEQKAWPQHEQHHRMPVQPIPQPPPEPLGAVFLNRQGQHIANAPVVQIAMVRMVDGMRPLPHVIGRQRQHTQGAPQPILRCAVAQVGGMAAIVLDDEQPHQKPAVQHGNRQRQPRRHIQRRPGQHPQKGERHQRHRQFEHRPPCRRLPIARKFQHPLPGAFLPG